MQVIKESAMKKLIFLYGKQKAEKTWEKLQEILLSYKDKIPKRSFLFTEKDVVFITYGDSFLSNKKNPLKTLHEFLSRYLKDIVSTIHILPFFPYSSDDGFSVINYKKVNSKIGNWEDIEYIAMSFNLMFDAVINHISSKSREFQEFLKGNPRFKNFFIEVDPVTTTDLSKVFRPRALPLTTEFKTKDKKISVWTTFSTDQIDLNFSNPDVLLYILDVILFYIEKGASIIRLDAVAYMWKEIGTSCIHLPQTHTVIKLFRDILDYIAPHVKIVTETNVPHKENISYFGNGHDEAHMVYQFALPPLTVHTLLQSDVTALSNWAKHLELPGNETYFYNFTASHDGIGVLPAKGILSDRQIDNIVEMTLKRGGMVGYKNNPDGTKSVYELNISLFDLISDPFKEEPKEIKASRFVASQAIALSLIGIPAIYYHSMIGSGNYYEGVRSTGINRSINREKLNIEDVTNALETKGTIRNLVYTKLSSLIKVRKDHKAFHPDGYQKILDLHQNIFAVERQAPDKDELILVLINVSDKKVNLDIDHPCKKDIISGRYFHGLISIQPFEILLLQQYPQN